MTDDLQAQLARLQAEVAQQEATVAELEGEVIELERELSEFQRRYDRLVMPVVTRLSALKAAIEELEHRRYVEKRMGDAPLSTSAPPPPTNYLPVEEQYRRAWEKQPDDDPPPIKPRRAESDGNVDMRLKRLYRQLARRYHPDLAGDLDDRERRNRLMALINEAYTSGDLEALEALSDQPWEASAGMSLDTLRLQQLQQTSERLMQRIERLKQEHAGLIHNDLMRLKVEEKLAQRKGHDLLAEMAEQMEQEYWEAMALLEKLRKS